MSPSKDKVLTSKPGVDRLWAVGPGIIRGVMHGPLENKSNSKVIVRIRGRWTMVQGPEVVKYSERFEFAVWGSLRNIHPLPDDAKLYFKATVYQENMLRDLDAELLPDLLQRNKIIKNDRAIWKKDYERKIDRENPRVEFEVGVIDAH